MSETLESIILEQSSIRQRNLVKPAKLAANQPDTGVQILKESAYYVIKDCATIAKDYVVFLAYASLESPVQSLKGLPTKSIITDFVKRSKAEHHTNQLLTLIFADINKISPPKVTVNIDTGPEFEFNNEDGPYGDYNYDGYMDAEDYKVSAPEVVVERIDMSDDNMIINKLIEIFAVKS